jgi:leucyl-tRNA synthetase
MISLGLSDEEVKKLALEDAKTKEAIGTKNIRKVIVVKGRLINVVVG